MTDRDDADPTLHEIRDAGQQAELMREVVTMMLYVSLSLLAVMLATPSVSIDKERIGLSLTVLGTGVGLVAAHHIAFRMSSRLTNNGLLSEESVHALKAQALGGLPVAVAAAIPPLLLGSPYGLSVSELLLLGLVLFVGYRSVRQAVSRGRAYVYLVGLSVIVVGLIAFKVFIGH